MKEDKISALRRWMVQKGCIIHPHVQIPTSFDGVLGIGTTGPLPHKTLIIAIPSSLILTTTKCYNDPKLKRLFEKNDDLFDYEASEDAEFNVLCVFMMYHRLHPESSPWREYFEAISQPQTAVDWTNFELKGLNRSIIEQVVHVRRECEKLQTDLIAYLKTRKEFESFSESILRETFHFCYRAVMNRSFGYYFSQTCLIPVADLVNHGCEAVDHQLININFELDKQFQEGYFPRRQKIDCSLMGIEPSKNQNLPFRHRFLVENEIIQNEPELLTALDRETINSHLYKWNSQRLNEGEKLQNLHFCSEDEEEDNDTDEDFEAEKERELEFCMKNEQEQMGEFMKHYVTIQNYSDVEKQLAELDNTKKHTVESEELPKEDLASNNRQQHETKQIPQTNCEPNQSSKLPSSSKDQAQTSVENPKQQRIQAPKANPFENAASKGVPIHIIDSQSQEQEQDDEEWGTKEGSYFTMSTSSPVSANKQIFNSYGSRTNRFLLIWYGFTYPNNLYDSVAFRLHVQFGPLRPARQIVLDTYVGGQGLSFRKNEHETVKQTEVSRQFRLKRSRICQKLIIFLRLYLMNYYKGADLYKLFVTFPASVDYELFVFNYYRDIVISLYQRYPLALIDQLKAEKQMQEYSTIRHKINYKIIYLQEQRKLLDLNMKACNHILAILSKCKENQGTIQRSMYEDIPIQDLRIIRKYLIQYQKHTPYILHKQQYQQQTTDSKPEKELPQKNQQPVNGPAEGQDDEEWQDQQQTLQISTK